MKVRRYAEKSHEMWDDTKGFQAIILKSGAVEAERVVERCKEFVESLQKLDDAWKAQFSEAIDNHEKLLSLSEEDLEQHLKEKYVQVNDIEIKGVSVKLENLLEMIEFPDFSEVVQAQQKAAKGYKYVTSVHKLQLSLNKFRKGTDWQLPKKLYEESLYEFTEQTTTEDQNYALQAGRKLLEAIADFHELGFPFSTSAGLGQNLDLLSRAVLTKNQDGLIDLNPRLLRNLKLKK